VTGADFNRVLVVLAVIEKRLNVRLGDMDVYVNVAGGVRVTEPAMDLGIALAIVSSVRDLPVPPGAVVFGEVGLAGELRAVSHVERRANEAMRLGFDQCVLPQKLAARLKLEQGAMQLSGANSLQEAVEAVLPGALRGAEKEKSFKRSREKPEAKKPSEFQRAQRAAQSQSTSTRDEFGGEDDGAAVFDV
jgi:DNA repair protein RadA/Sms